MAVNKSFITLTPRANVIKLLNVVIYCHSMVILSFGFIKPYYRGNYHGIIVNHNGICATNVIEHILTENESKLRLYFKPRKSRVLLPWLFTAVLFYNIGPRRPVL
jgi:hypothetical protein